MEKILATQKFTILLCIALVLKLIVNVILPVQFPPVFAVSSE